jgi:hypothetical protein
MNDLKLYRVASGNDICVDDPVQELIDDQQVFFVLKKSHKNNENFSLVWNYKLCSGTADDEWFKRVIVEVNMKSPLVIEYLKSHSFSQLFEEHGVKAHNHGLRNKVSLNYNQFMIKSGDKLAEECRGMVIRPKNVDALLNDKLVVGEVELLAWPLDRFYNYGDPACENIRLGDPDVVIQEKLDGTMCIVYYDGKAWCVATRSNSDGSNQVSGVLSNVMQTFEKITFAELFLKTLATQTSKHIQLSLNTLEKKNTYVFELTCAINRVVVKHEIDQITLLAIRETLTGQEQTCENALDFYDISSPKVWSLNDWSDLQAFVDDADPAKLEGAVVLDAQFRRVKIKNKAYVMTSRMSDIVNFSPRTLIQSIIDETIDDVIPLLDKSVLEKIDEVKDKLTAWRKKINEQFVALKIEAAGDRKTFSRLVHERTSWYAPFYEMLSNNQEDVLGWLQNSRMLPSTFDTLLKEINR